MSSIVVPKGYSFVLASIVGSGYVLVYQMMTVNKWRNRASIPYPRLYADKEEAAASQDAHIFNCAQRAHQNTLEILPIFLTGTMVSGLKVPKAAAALGVLWIFSRIQFTRGYITGDPEKRNAKGGNFGRVSLMGLLGLSAWTVIDLIRQGI